MVEAGALLRRARERAHLSARELAARSGVSASTVSRIERGEMNPTVAMLERLVDAAGGELILESRTRSEIPTLVALRKHRQQIIDVVKSFGGSKVWVFGSVARQDARPDSDVDLLIEVPAGTGLVTIERMAEAIEALLPWRVDILTTGSARGRLAHITREAVRL